MRNLKRVVTENHVNKMESNTSGKQASCGVDFATWVMLRCGHLEDVRLNLQDIQSYDVGLQS